MNTDKIVELQKMSLDEQIQIGKKQIITDTYSISIGELMNLYKDGELILNSDAISFFWWNIQFQSNFIESILLNIPLNSIFVMQTEDGCIEIIDGLQRVSTILQFVGLLKNTQPQPLVGTDFLPALEGKFWKNTIEAQSFNFKQQVSFKRAVLDLKIIKQTSVDFDKVDLFNRLNPPYSKP